MESWTLVNIGSGNDLMPSSDKPLPEQMLTYGVPVASTKSDPCSLFAVVVVGVPVFYSQISL